jgi:hypothetical protein
MKLAGLILGFLTVALPVLSFADEPQLPPPTRFLVIRTWRSDTLTMMSSVPLYPSHPATIECGSGGPAVPEEMVQPAMKVSSLVQVSLTGAVPAQQPANQQEIDEALRRGNRFVVDDVEIKILERDSDRFVAVIFDSEAGADEAVALPEELGFSDGDKSLIPAGVMTAWVSGGLTHPRETVLLETNPQPASITLHDGDDGSPPPATN